MVRYKQSSIHAIQNDTEKTVLLRPATGPREVHPLPYPHQTLAERPQLLPLSRVLVSRLQAEKNKTALRHSDPAMRALRSMAADFSHEAQGHRPAKIPER
jgi:hypothetical protein